MYKKKDQLKQTEISERKKRGISFSVIPPCLRWSVSLRYQMICQYNISNWLVLCTYQWDVAKMSHIDLSHWWWRLSMVHKVLTYMGPKWDFTAMLHARWGIRFSCILLPPTLHKESYKISPVRLTICMSVHWSVTHFSQDLRSGFS